MQKPRRPRRARGSPPQAWRNFAQPMPLNRKLRLFYRNMWARFRGGLLCCGHPGEPGC